MDNRFRNFLSSLKYLVLLMLVGVLLFLIYRLLFLISYGNLGELSNNLFDVAKAFAVGFKFDFKVMAIMLMPIAFLCLLQLLNNNSKLVYGFYYRFSLFYGTITFILLSTISVIDFYFYKFFNSHISVLFFGIIEDNTKAVLKSVWTDYPIVLIVVSLIAATILIYLLLRFLFKREIKWVYVQSPLLRTAIVLIFIGIYFLGLRGSTGMKPLGVRHATISGNSFINALTLNGPFSLSNAFSDKKESKINTDIPRMLKEHGFATPREAIAQYLGRNVIDSIPLENNLLETSPVDTFLESTPPTCCLCAYGKYERLLL